MSLNGFMRRRSYRDEEYLEAILILRQRSGVVRVKDLAAILGVKPPTVVERLEKLAEKNLIVYRKGEGVIELTEKGLAKAREVYRRHELLRKFFTLIGVDEATAEQDACSVEHVISEATLRALERLVACIESSSELARCVRG